MIITLPIPVFVSIVWFAVLGLSCDGVQPALDLQSGIVGLSLSLFEKHFIGMPSKKHGTASSPTPEKSVTNQRTTRKDMRLSNAHCMNSASINPL